MQRTATRPATVVYRRMLLFFVLSCALAWAGIAGNAIVESAAWPQPMNPLGPLVAAPIVIALTEGRAGLRAWWARIRRFRAPRRVYAASILIPTAIIFGSAGLAALTGVHFDTSDWQSLPLLLAVSPLYLIFGPLPEELSFRGYGQHEFQRIISPLAASLWIGFGVLAWHLPLLVLGDIPWTVAIVLPAVSVVYAWLYCTGGSVWPLVALHLVQNVLGGDYIGLMIDDRGDVIWFGFIAAAYIGWVIVIVSRHGRSLGLSDSVEQGAEGVPTAEADRSTAASAA